jgi:hypothetical protein
MLTEANEDEGQHHGRDADQDLPSATTRKAKNRSRSRTMQVAGEATNQSQRPRFLVRVRTRRPATSGSCGSCWPRARRWRRRPRPPAARRLRRLQEGREVAHGGRGAVRLAHHVVQRRRRAAAQLALPVVQDRARDAATHATRSVLHDAAGAPRAYPPRTGAPHTGEVRSRIGSWTRDPLFFCLHGCGCEGEQQQEREREHPARVGVAVAVAAAAAAEAAAAADERRRRRDEPERGEREHGRRAETCRLHATPRGHAATQAAAAMNQY